MNEYITEKYGFKLIEQHWCDGVSRIEKDDVELSVDDCFEELAKANERVNELEQAIDNELIIHCSVTEGSPEEKVKRLLDVACSWALDPKVSEQANKFAIEKKIEGIDYLLRSIEPSIKMGAKGLWRFETYEVEAVKEQLRKEQE